MKSENQSNNGIGLLTILFLIFLTLKLGGWGDVATWSWWWVCSPLWIPWVLLGVVAIIALLVAIFNELFNNY
jgi:hypothetical protein